MYMQVITLFPHLVALILFICSISVHNHHHPCLFCSTRLFLLLFWFSTTLCPHSPTMLVFPDVLLSKQGPLAHVWLAANYDRKLSKLQLLGTNIVKSSNFIANPSNESSTITLRLSGQLLYGIVRIYLRKTKYLLDDVNDILYKLKNSFRYMSRLNVDSALVAPQEALTGGVVALSTLLPVQLTVISNINQISLPDQATDFDLLYQEDLNLSDDDDEEPAEIQHKGAVEASANSYETNDSFEDVSIDRSIELPRKNNSDDFEDIDLDLDFDLEDQEPDKSIELGRNAPAVDIQHEMSEMSLDLDKNQSMDMDMDMDMDLDLGQLLLMPLETVEEESELEQMRQTRPEREKRRLVGISEDGSLKTTKRRLVVDSVRDVESGILMQTLRSLQHQQLNHSNAPQFITLPLTDAEKLELIKELSQPLTRMHSHLNINTALQLTAQEVHRHEKEDATTGNDISFDLDQDLDLSISGLDETAEITRIEPEKAAQEPILSFDDDQNEETSSLKSTTRVAQHIRSLLEQEQEKIPTLDDIITKDKLEETPLGLTNGTLNSRKEATKSFFELLVLATNDCISIKQSLNAPQEIGGLISIQSKDKLFEKFLVV